MDPLVLALMVLGVVAVVASLLCAFAFLRLGKLHAGR